MGANAVPINEDQNVAADQAGAVAAAGEVVADVNETCLSCLGAIFHFTVNVTDLQESNCVHSSSIMLSNVPWKITFCKRARALDAILSPDHDDRAAQPSAWSCDATAIFKLHPKNADKNNTISIILPEETFSSSTTPQPIQIISNWTQFLDEYVRDNEATFEIEILTGPLSSKVPTNMVQTKQTFHIVLENVCTSNEFFSPEIMLRNIKWRIHVQKLQDSVLGVSLQALDTDPNWSYNVSCNINIFSFNKNVEPIVFNSTHTFNGKSSETEIGHVMWSQFVDESSKYVVRDKAIMQVEMGVEQPKPFWQPKRNIGLGKENGVIESEVNRGIVIELPCSHCLQKFSSGQIFFVKCGHLYCQPCYRTHVYSIDRCEICGERVVSASAVYF